MTDPNLIILYVKDPAASAAFYKELLGREPSSSFPTYVAFALEGGFTLGLWSIKRPAESLSPAPAEAGNRTELAFTVDDAASVEKLHGAWSARGVTIAQQPKTDVFGRTFVALDPDGHRLRVCTPDK
jgi:catechol 2,3-dioxygenase-like lactoylglutathione lyase family enzyme